MIFGPLQAGVSASCRCADGDVFRRGICSPCYQCLRRRDHELGARLRKLERRRRRASIDKARAASNRCYMRNKDRRYMAAARRKYGLSPADYHALLDIQGGRCAICQTPAERFPTRLHVDHDHDTGDVRGLLCAPCNQGLGYHEKHETGAWGHYLAFPPMKELRYRRGPAHQEASGY